MIDFGVYGHRAIVNNSECYGTTYTLTQMSFAAVGVSWKNHLFFCLVWFNAFSLFPFGWSHLESLEMVSEALSHTWDECSKLFMFLCLSSLSLELTASKAFYFHFGFWLCLIFLMPQSHLKIVAHLFELKNDWRINLATSGITLWRCVYMFQQQHK